MTCNTGLKPAMRKYAAHGYRIKQRLSTEASRTRAFVIVAAGLPMGSARS